MPFEPDGVVHFQRDANPSLRCLAAGSFTFITCKDDSRFGGKLLSVNFCNDSENAPACLEVTPEGLALHFNSAYGGRDLQGETVWLPDIVAVG